MTTRQPKFCDARGRRLRRIPMGTSGIPPLEAAIRAEMNRPPYPSRAFVIAACCGYALGVDEQADYREIRKRKRKKAQR